MSKITQVKARQILDSRGNPTVEVDVFSEKGFARASVPSGASTGMNEMLELRDGGNSFHGKGVNKAVANVLKIGKKIKGRNVFDQEEIDKLMLKLDGTSNKSRLGANSMLGVSLAVCRAAALEKNDFIYPYIASLFENKKVNLPIPMFNLINGGKHAENDLDIQEYMLVPNKAKSFSEALQIGSEVDFELKKLLINRFGKLSANVGDEGGFAPRFECVEEPIDFILDAVNELGYSKKVSLAIDCAATTFFRKGRYYLEGQEYKNSELIDYYSDLVKSYPLLSIEDPFFEEDFDSFTLLNKKIGKQVMIVGDDLTVSNPKRIQKAIVSNSCNCLLLKPNQIGTVTETLESAKLALSHSWNVITSHRSGETNDDFISDLAVGLGCGWIKAGAPCRGERLAKYNQLLRIEESLGKKARFGRS
ncbi:phosphopyruvate hydratase [archaeon]|nr:phosphopyruvate hydratase [archaeon]